MTLDWLSESGKMNPSKRTTPPEGKTMNMQEFEAKFAKIVKAYGITSAMACEAQENCDDFELGTPEWFECFEASIESLLDDEE